MITDNNHLLVLCATSNQKEKLRQAFTDFEEKYGVDCYSVKKEIDRHDKYMTNQKLYFKYTARLPFLRQFRSKREDVLKLLAFYETFDQSKTSFWTITRKRFPLENIIFKSKNTCTGSRLVIEFEEINQAEKNLRQLVNRLDRYGYHFKKYILVPEIKEEDSQFNYHYHLIVEAEVNVKKIRSNSKAKYRNLVYNPLYGDMSNGWIDYPLLSDIWKEITKDGSYRIKREKIKKKYGVLHYVLAYINKGIEYKTYEAVPYLYFALKSKKAYRVKGCSKMPKIKYQILDHSKQRLIFNPMFIDWVEEKDIKADSQEYYLRLLRDDTILEDKHIIEYFKMDLDRTVDGNRILARYDPALFKRRITQKTTYKND